MYARQKQHKTYPLRLIQDQILEGAYEYTIREDILLSLEYNDLTAKQASTLLKLDTPLAAIYQKYDSQKSHHMDDIWSTVESRANESLRTDFIASRRTER